MNRPTWFDQYRVSAISYGINLRYHKGLNRSRAFSRQREPSMTVALSTCVRVGYTPTGRQALRHGSRQVRA